MAEDRESAARDTPERDEMSEAEIDRTLAASFPASDPPSWTLGTDRQEEPPGEHGAAAAEGGEAE
jgi:hypothetical protein